MEKISNEELIKIREEIINLLDKTEDELLEKKASYDEIKIEKQKTISEMIEKLLGKKDLFGNVFKTENGSIYFVTESKNTLRFKKENGDWSCYPIMSEIIFVEDKEAEKILEAIKSGLYSEYLLSSPIKISNIALGVFPFDFSLCGFPRIAFTKKDGFITFRGTFMMNNGKEEVVESISSGVHLGHKIIDIIK